MTDVANLFELVVAALFLLYWFVIVLPNLFWCFYDKSEIGIKDFLIRNAIFIFIAGVFLFFQGPLQNYRWIMNVRGLLLLTGFLAVYGVLYVFFYFLPMCNILKGGRNMSYGFQWAMWRRDVYHLAVWRNFLLLIMLVAFGFCFFNWDYISFNP